MRMNLAGPLLVVVGLAGAWIWAVMGASPYEQAIVVNIGIFAMLAISLNIVIGYTDLVSFGHAGFFALGAYAGSLLAVELGGGLLVAAIGAVIAGAFLAIIIAGASIKLSGVYFALATLGAAEIVRIVSLNWIDVTRGALGLNIPFQERTLFADVVLSPDLLLNLTIGSVVVLMGVVWLLLQSDIGRRMVSIRENPELAAALGTRPFTYRTLALCISGAFAAYAGALYAFNYGIVTPSLGGVHYTALPILMVMFGGRGTQIGPLIGAATFIIVPELLGIEGALGEVVFAVILLVVVLLAPRGLVGSVTHLVRRARLKRSGSTDSADEDLSMVGVR